MIKRCYIYENISLQANDKAYRINEPMNFSKIFRFIKNSTQWLERPNLPLCFVCGRLSQWIVMAEILEDSGNYNLNIKVNVLKYKLFFFCNK